MKISVTNFMGCDSASIEVSGIALIAGLNHQGKSSFCRAVAACLSGETVPLGLRKADAGMLIASGKAKADVRIETESGVSSIEWPKAERYTDGTPAYAHPIAAGIGSFPTLKEKDALNVITALIDAEPKFDDLKAALPDQPEKVVYKVWQAIERDGWEVAHAHAIERGKEFKFQWKQVTGANYGSKVAESWSPAKWSDALDGKSQDSLAANVTACRAELEDAIAQSAVNAADLARLREHADRLPTIKKEIADKEHALASSRDVLEQYKREREELPAIDQKNILQCPHCEKDVVVDKIWKGPLTIKKAEPLSEKELREREILRAELDGKIQNAEGKVGAHEADLRGLQTHRSIAEDAVQKIADLDSKGGGAVLDVDEYRERLRMAEDDLEAFNQRVEADRHQRNVLANQKIIDALDQTGVRRTVLLRELDRVNRRLAELSEMAGWGRVSIGSDMVCEYGGRPYLLLSDSEQYRTRATIQVAISELSKSDMVVFDAAEVLDGKGRVGLLKMLHKLRMPAVVSMMLSRKDAAPDLSANGSGATYWVENGTISKFEDRRAA
ncbi:hypothetical protein [Sneathiella sp.]|uniref:hypothetical protein n=1 Tax=Sneathiella sp. TaxID=1964365 RepID=UPI002FE2BA44